MRILNRLLLFCLLVPHAASADLPIKKRPIPHARLQIFNSSSNAIEVRMDGKPLATIPKRSSLLVERLSDGLHKLEVFGPPNKRVLINENILITSGQTFINIDGRRRQKVPHPKTVVSKVSIDCVKDLASSFSSLSANALSTLTQYCRSIPHHTVQNIYAKILPSCKSKLVEKDTACEKSLGAIAVAKSKKDKDFRSRMCQKAWLSCPKAILGSTTTSEPAPSRRCEESLPLSQSGKLKAKNMLWMLKQCRKSEGAVPSLSSCYVTKLENRKWCVEQAVARLKSPPTERIRLDIMFACNRSEYVCHE